MMKRLRERNKTWTENILEPSKMGKERAREDMSGIMAKFSRETGRKAKKMDMGFGNLQTVIHTWVIG